MVVAITPRQWSGLIESLGVASKVTVLEAELGLSFAGDEGLRYQHRDRLWPIFETAIGAATADDLSALFDEQSVTWAPYRTIREAAAIHDRFGIAGAMETIAHPSGHSYPAPGAAARFATLPRIAVLPAPKLGQHTDEILSSLLGLRDEDIARLHDRNLVA